MYACRCRTQSGQKETRSCFSACRLSVKSLQHEMQLNLNIFRQLLPYLRANLVNIDTVEGSVSMWRTAVLKIQHSKLTNTPRSSSIWQWGESRFDLLRHKSSLDIFIYVKCCHHTHKWTAHKASCPTPIARLQLRQKNAKARRQKTKQNSHFYVKMCCKHFQASLNLAQCARLCSI